MFLYRRLGHPLDATTRTTESERSMNLTYLINTMGKTGSTSMLHTLRSVDIYAQHEHSMLKCKPIKGKYKVFVPIREVVSRNISAFFENYYKGKRLTSQEFVYMYHHVNGVLWVDREIGGCWGVDVYSTPFDTSKGWKIYETKDASILIIRLENFATGWSDAYKKFMGTETAPVMMRMNVTLRDNGKKEEYKRFLEEETPPDYYINWMNSSSYMQHFYPDMIERN